MHFGHNYLYGSFSIDKKAPELPDFVRELLRRCHESGLIASTDFDQMTVQEYQPGSGIRIGIYQCFETLSFTSTSCRYSRVFW